MKKLFLYLFVNCQNSNEKIPENLEFDMRKYLVSEELLYLLETEISNYKILFDSVVEYPKYRYLENELETYKSAHRLIEEGM